MKKTCFFALSLFCVASFAQPRLEYDIHYGFGSSETGLNNIVGIAAAAYPFANNFGLSVGLEYSSKEKRYNNAVLEENQNLVDGFDGDELIFIHRFYNHEETRTATAMQIPILLRYTQETYYASAGVKIGIPLTTETKASYSALDVEGKYPGVDYTFKDLEFQGFGSQPGGSFKQEFDSDVLFMLAIEYGAKFEITDNMALMMGVFAERALNDGFDKDFGPKVKRQENGNKATSTVNEATGWNRWNPWTVGVQFKFSFMH